MCLLFWDMECVPLSLHINARYITTNRGFCMLSMKQNTWSNQHMGYRLIHEIAGIKRTFVYFFQSNLLRNYASN